MSTDRFNVPLYRPFEKLISITVKGQPFQIPENQILLRAFQYLCPETIPFGRYCWNEECQYCRVIVRKPGSEKISQALSCKLMAEEGLEVVELAPELQWNLSQLFQSPGHGAPGAEDASGAQQPKTE